MKFSKELKELKDYKNLPIGTTIEFDPGENFPNFSNVYWIKIKKDLWQKEPPTCNPPITISSKDLCYSSQLTGKLRKVLDISKQEISKINPLSYLEIY